jgi:hypothetical protein
MVLKRGNKKEKKAGARRMTRSNSSDPDGLREAIEGGKSYFCRDSVYNRTTVFSFE